MNDTEKNLRTKKGKDEKTEQPIKIERLGLPVDLAPERDHAERVERAKLPVKLDFGAYLPESAYTDAAGLDLKSPVSVRIPAGGSAVIDTGVHVMIPKGHCGLLVSKSGLNVRHGITSTGLIDADYRGSICVKLYNQSGLTYYVSAGDKISQLLIFPYLSAVPMEVKELDDTERGNRGFGSSGK